MNDVTTGMPSLRASSATGASSRKRRTSTPSIITGRLCTRDALEHFIDAIADGIQGDDRRGQHRDRLARRIDQVAWKLEIDRA